MSHTNRFHLPESIFHDYTLSFIFLSHQHAFTFSSCDSGIECIKEHLVLNVRLLFPRRGYRTPIIEGGGNEEVTSVGNVYRHRRCTHTHIMHIRKQ